MTVRHRDAVIVRAGAKSLHGAWADPDRRFDLLVVPYENIPKTLEDMATECVLIPGKKVEGWRELFRRRPDLLDAYEQIALLDDDLLSSPADIDRCFAIGREHALSLWQPALTWDSHFSHGVSLCNPLFKLRFVNFVEMMCPFFSSDQLKRTLPLFDLGLETAIDTFWCRLRPDWQRAYAVVDAVSIKHTRRVGADAARQGFEAKQNAYRDPLIDLASRSGVSFKGPVAYAGVTRRGRSISRRAVMAAMSLTPLAGWAARADPKFLKPISDHCRHILTRPISDEPIDLVELSSRLRLP